ncbi:MAG: hypothetical protein JWQ72_3938 [Polaromonas sp.]|nr:hypothetical protein [Polaromonas sp.]
MNRCKNPLFVAALLLATVTALLAPLSARAQTASADDVKPNVRRFPKEAVRGVLVITAAPEAAVDGKADRLSPGVRIRDVNNNLILSNTMAGQKLVVNYVRDNIGLVHQVWILNAEEARQKMPGEDGGGILNSIRSIFETKPATNDGKTPYDKLPKY